jgi:hypothetical protein
MNLFFAIAGALVTFHASDSMAIEEPPYEVEKNYGSFEVRKYPAVLVAQTEVPDAFEDAGNKAFRVLADYIFGNNISKTKIDMTAPVTQQSEKISMTAPVSQTPVGSGYLVQFMMPKKYTLATLPTPVDARVKIVEIPARRIAVYTYSGSWSEERFSKKLAQFRKSLQEHGVQTSGEPIFARFNSPFALWFLRRNEIWLNL